MNWANKKIVVVHSIYLSLNSQNRIPMSILFLYKLDLFSQFRNILLIELNIVDYNFFC